MEVFLNLKVLQGVINEMAANDYAAHEHRRELPLLSVEQLLLSIKTLLSVEQSEALIAKLTFPSPRECRAILAERAALPLP